MDFRPEERVRVKLEFLRMLARMKLDPARMELLAVFFETYLKLNREEEEQLYRELGKWTKWRLTIGVAVCRQNSGGGPGHHMGGTEPKLILKKIRG